MQDESENKNEKNLVHIETYANEMEAQLAQTTLKAAGIEGVLVSDGAEGMLQMLEYVEGISLYVDEDKAEEAKTVLEQQSMPPEEGTEPAA